MHWTQLHQLDQKGFSNINFMHRQQISFVHPVKVWRTCQILGEKKAKWQAYNPVTGKQMEN